MHRLRFDSCAADCKAAAASFIDCSLLFGSAPGCEAACWAAAAAQTAGSTPGGGGIRGGKPGTRPKGGIIGSGGAFGALAGAGAGAAAAFSFLTLEAGFLGMVPGTRWRSCAWGRGAGMPLRWAGCLCLWLSAHGRRGGAKRRRTLCQQAGTAHEAGVGARKGSGCPFCTWLAQAQVGWNSLFSTSGKPFPLVCGASLCVMDAGVRLAYSWYRCGGALVHCRPD